MTFIICFNFAARGAAFNATFDAGIFHWLIITFRFRCHEHSTSHAITISHRRHAVVKRHARFTFIIASRHLRHSIFHGYYIADIASLIADIFIIISKCSFRQCQRRLIYRCAHFPRL